MVLLNPLEAAEGSFLGWCAETLARVESLGHVMFWSESRAFLGDECLVSLVELPRLFVEASELLVKPRRFRINDLPMVAPTDWIIFFSRT